jgi:hypothetical protein
VSLVDRALTDGVHGGSANRWFTSAYFHHPDEPAVEAAAAGLREPRTVAVESAAHFTGAGLLNLLADERQTAALLGFLRRIETEPSALGASSHLLTIAYRATP